MKVKKLIGVVDLKGNPLDEILRTILEHLEGEDEDHLSVPVGEAPPELVRELHKIREKREDQKIEIKRKHDDFMRALAREYQPKDAALDAEHKAAWAKIETALDLNHDGHYHIKKSGNQVFKKVKPNKENRFQH